MRQALRKILVVALSVGFAVSAPALSHAQAATSHIAGSHENHDVQSYADLSVEPDDSCPHGTGGAIHDHDTGVCKKCCAACLGASLMPAPPAALWVVSKPIEPPVHRVGTLVARVVPTEPGIPKPL